jgi:hypothetical protein
VDEDPRRASRGRTGTHQTINRWQNRVLMDLPRCYLICANARCGSTLLSRALSDTGIAGHPDEYFVTGPLVVRR